MAEGREHSHTASAAGGVPAPADPEVQRMMELIRFPRRALFISGAVALFALALVLSGTSGLIPAVCAASALVCVFSAWNIANFSLRAIDRLKVFSRAVGGRFSPLKVGAGGYNNMLFAYGAEYERFDVANYVAHGIPIEIGHAASELEGARRAPLGRRHAYVVFRLPKRLPHMIINFGRLVRVAPEQWHRSQRADVGFGSRVRFFVADGGEWLARGFFTPEMV